MCARTVPSSPHKVTYGNLSEQVVEYPYDYKLFHPNAFCTTCQLPKPARSKHCSLCRICVARADHHCIWVNNCLGRGNYKFFVALLCTTSIMLAYGAFLAKVTLWPEVQDNFRQYPEWHHYDFSAPANLPSRILRHGEWLLDVIGTAFMIGGLSRGGVGLLALFTAPLPFALLVYHIYLIWSGMTTNESGKWSDWQEDMRDGLAFVADIDPLMAKVEHQSSTPSSIVSSDTNLWKQSRWPKRSSQFLVLTTDGQTPRNLQPPVMDVVGSAKWKRVWRLREIDNTYDLGFWGNLKDVLTN